MMTKPIPIMDIQDEINFLWDDLNAEIQSVLRSGQFIMGDVVREFEEEIAAYLGIKHAIGLNSGTDAILIALHSLGIGEGDEVITTAFTFFATTEGVSQLGAKPVFVDIEPETFNMDLGQLEAKITERTKVIMPVHLFGQAVDMERLLDIATRHQLKIVEDVAQAMGASYQGKKLGSFSDIAAFSFFPSKTLGAYGDAGLVATNDDELADIARMLHKHGSRKKYHNEMLGYNSRLDSIQAAILKLKLPYLEEWNQKRMAAAAYYSERLAEIPIVVPPVTSGSAETHVFHQYTIRVLRGQRDTLQEHLKRENIQTMIYYPVPLHRLPIYAQMNVSLPCTEQACSEVLSLPLWPFITREQQDRVIQAIRAFC